jgi:hypothetical protein
LLIGVGEDEGWEKMGVKKNLAEEVLQITQVTYIFPKKYAPHHPLQNTINNQFNTANSDLDFSELISKFRKLDVHFGSSRI